MTDTQADEIDEKVWDAPQAAPLMTWDRRLVQRLGGEPFRASVIITLGHLVSFFGVAWLLGIYPIVRPGDPNLIDIPSNLFVFGFDPYAWAAIVTSLLSGHVYTVMAYTQPRSLADLERMAPVLEGYDAEDIRKAWFERQRAAYRYLWPIRIFLWIAGVCAMFVTVFGAWDLVTLQSGERELPSRYYFGAVWFLIAVPPQFAAFGQSALSSLVDLRFSLDLFRKALRPNLLYGRDQLRPITRKAIRTALAWILACTIVSLFFFSGGVNAAVIAPLFIVTSGFAIAVLMQPLMSAHRAIVRSKREAMASIEAEIEGAGGARVGEALSNDPAGNRLLGLLALQQRIEQVGEWPIDLPTVARFLLYLAIPVLSWVGGALVEQVVSAAIE